MKVTVKTGFALFVISKYIKMEHIGIAYELTKVGIPLKTRKSMSPKLAKFSERAIDSIDNPCYNELTCQVKGEDYTCYRMSNKLRDELLKGIEEAKIEEMDFTSYKDYWRLEQDVFSNVQRVTPWLNNFCRCNYWTDRVDIYRKLKENVITEEYIKELKYKYSDVKYEGMTENDPFDWWFINASNYFYHEWRHDKYNTPHEVRRRAWLFFRYLDNPPIWEIEQDKLKKPKRKKKDTETSTEDKPKKKTTRRKKEKEE